MVALARENMSLADLGVVMRSWRGNVIFVMGERLAPDGLPVITDDTKPKIEGKREWPKDTRARARRSLCTKVPSGTSRCWKLARSYQTVGWTVYCLAMEDEEAQEYSFCHSKIPAPEISENGNLIQEHQAIGTQGLGEDVGLSWLSFCWKIETFLVSSLQPNKNWSLSFHTIVPNLGMVRTRHQSESFAVARQPGLSWRGWQRLGTPVPSSHRHTRVSCMLLICQPVKDATL